MSEIKVSIVIPIYNSEKCLARCISSLKDQTLKEIEIICVDDCSSDGSMEILKELASEDSRIKLLFNEKNSGTLMTRKKGVSEASGEYIMFADNDDWYELTACEVAYKKIKEAQVDILMYGVSVVGGAADDDSKARKRYLSKSLIPKPEKYKGDNCIKIENRINLLWNKIFKSEVCKEGYKNTNDIFLTYSEDTYPCNLIHYLAKSFMAIPDKLYNYNYSAGITGKRYQSIETFDLFCACMRNMEYYINLFFDEMNAPEYVRSIFDAGNKERLEYCLTIWREKLSDKDAAEGFDILCKYYERSSAIESIHNNWERLRLSKIALDKSNRKINKKNRAIRKSTSFKIGRAITYLPRIVKAKY